MLFWSAQAALILWGISEVMLLFWKRGRKEVSRSRDRSTLRFLWLIISISMTAGIYIGVKGLVGRLDSLAVFWVTAGVFLLAGGILLRWYAVFTLKRFFTVDVRIQQDHKLIQHGPYRYLRHPAYTGVLLAFAGVGMIYANVVTFFLVIIPVVLTFLFRIKTEEKAMVEAFGQDYQDYVKKTWCLVPFLY